MSFHFPGDSIVNFNTIIIMAASQIERQQDVNDLHTTYGVGYSCVTFSAPDGTKRELSHNPEVLVQQMSP